MKAEIRQDFLSGRYVIISPQRQSRPRQLIETGVKVSSVSPFTKDKIKKENILATLGHGQEKIISLKNKFPAVTPTNKKAYGYHEVIIETPEPDLQLADLTVKQIKNLFKMYQRRTKFLLKQKDINYVTCFKNQGVGAGASLIHAHSQILATALMPPRIVELEEKSRTYQLANHKFLLGDIIKQELKSPRKIFTDKTIAVFCPYASFYEYEAWLVIKRPVVSFLDLTDKELTSLAKSLLKILKTLQTLGVDYNFFFHATSTNLKEHFFVKVEPRMHVWAGIELDSSLTINFIEPEKAALIYRQQF